MSYPAYPPPSPSRRGLSTTAIVLIVVLAVLAGIAAVGAVGVVALTVLRRSGHSSAASPAQPAPPPSPSSAMPPTPPDLARYYGQKLDWRTCGGDECTRLRVPLDYAQPDARSITLAVVRVPAENRSRRVGQLVVNPGGPGASGVQHARRGAEAFGSRLTRVYDIVGFDPRGVGESAPVECLDARETDSYLSSDPDPDTPAETQRFGELQRDFGEGCVRRSGELASHISTVEAAKDMDVLRAALGEPKLDYLGSSYGTFLGSTYADLFPTHVGRMVLDGAIDPALSTEELTLVQAKGFQTALNAYLEGCVSDGNCPLGDSVAEGGKRLREFLDGLDAKPLPTGTDRELTEGLGVYGVILPLYVKSYWPVLSQALAQALRGDGNALLQISDQYNSRGPNGYTDNSVQALFAINCLDHGDPVPLDQVAAKEAEFERASPAFGRFFAFSLAGCDGWPVGSHQPTKAPRAAGAPPIVVVGTTRDPATPYSMAVSLAHELESGHLITRDGDGHTGFHMGNDCVDHAVEDYVINRSVPPAGLHC